MVESCADSATDRIGQAFTRTQVAKQTGGKSSAESLVKNFNSIVSGVISGRAQVNHANRALVYIFLGDHVVAGLSGLELDVRFFDRRLFRPASEGLSKFGFHSGGIKIVRYAKDDVIRMNVGVVPIDQIL